MSQSTITLCSSVAFYRRLNKISEQLEHLGFRVLVPETAQVMAASGDYGVAKHKVWISDPTQYRQKTRFIERHFQKIKQGDAVLVVNETKNGIPGYIGGNVLMEMTIAYEYRKPIIILNPIDPKLPVAEEVYGLQPTFINGNLEKISLSQPS